MGLRRESKRRCTLQFVLYKENVDTAFALKLLARAFKVRDPDLRYAGVKDRRAITTQFISIDGVTETDMLSFFTSHSAAISNERVVAEQDFRKIFHTAPQDFLGIGNFEMVPTALRLGSLSGNRFVITLRGVDPSLKDHLLSRAQTLERFGTLNYFGSQRFGNGRHRTYDIGRAFLQRRYADCVNMLLAPSFRDGVAAVQYKSEWLESHDATKALALCPMSAH